MFGFLKILNLREWAEVGLVSVLVAVSIWALRVNDLRERHKTALEEAQKVLVQTQENYKNAQTLAVIAQDQKIQAVQNSAKATLAQAGKDYEIRITDLRSSFARQLQSASKASCNFGPSGGGEATSLPVLSRGTVSSGGDAIVSAKDAQLGWENSERLEALIEAWNKTKAEWDEQAKVKSGNSK